MHILINCLFVLLIVGISNIESMNVNKTNQSWNKIQNNQEDSIIKIQISFDIHESSSPNESSRFCIPFYSCSSYVNGTSCVILVAFVILAVCCRYHCSEYCDIKNELDRYALQRSKRYLQKEDFQYERNDLV